MKIKRHAGRVKSIHSGGLIRIVAQAALPTRFGYFTVLGIRGRAAAETAVALRHGELSGRLAVLVRVHSQCLPGDALTSKRCDCGAQLQFSLRKIVAAPGGILIYLPQEGLGIGLMNKLRAYELRDGGIDTVEANKRLGFPPDLRNYRFVARALRLLGIRRVRLLSNDPDKVQQLERYGIHVIERVPCQPRGTSSSRAYLLTKSTKLGHLLANL
jgi:GTP cyclohydrolase II